MDKSGHHDEKLNALFELSPDFICVLDEDGTITDCNELILDQFGYSKHEVIGKSCFDFFSDDEKNKALLRFKIVKNQGIGLGTEFLFRKKNGTTFHGLCKGIRLQNEEIKPNKYVITIKDTTEIHDEVKKIEKNQIQLEKKIERVTKLSSMKDEFLAMITHELKTPLVPIQGYADILLGGYLGELNEEQIKRLEIIRSSTTTMLSLISDLLDAEKLELKQLKMKMGTHDPSEIISGVILKLKPDTDNHNIIITTNLQEKLTCVCDKNRIEQVMMNLIANAMNFCPKENGIIHIKLDSDNAGIGISVMDNGTGIEKDKLDKIFVKFYQIDVSTTREYGGTGLGLSICKGIIENHGGKIWAESEGLGNGTTIKIQLPLRQ